MSGFVKDANRVDPYKTYKFRVIWNGKPVLGVSKVGPLKRSTAVVPHRSEGENSVDNKAPGRPTYDALTLERGITHDLEFEAWVNKVHPYAGDAGMDLGAHKKELTLEVMNEKGLVALRYFLHGCWVSEFTSVPDMDANSDTVAIESIKLELESWERDVDTKEPDPAAAVPTG